MTPPSDYEPSADMAPQAPPYAPSRPGYYRDPRLKSPVLAGVLSLMPGLGQVYLGYTQLGFLHAGAAATMICLLSSNGLGRLEPLVGVFMAFFWLYNVVDAHRRAILINECVTRLETPELPRGLQSFSFQGRLMGGLILIAVGVMALLEKRFGVSMEWIYTWWPAGLVLLGLYLLVRAVKDRATQGE